MVTKREFKNPIDGNVIAEYSSDSGKMLRFIPTGAVCDSITHFTDSDAQIEETEEDIPTR